MEIKREMLSECQLKIPALYNIPIGNVKKLLPNFFDKERNTDWPIVFFLIFLIFFVKWCNVCLFQPRWECKWLYRIVDKRT